MLLQIPRAAGVSHLGGIEPAAGQQPWRGVQQHMQLLAGCIQWSSRNARLAKPDEFSDK
jgi:hypothetical protein